MGNSSYFRFDDDDKTKYIFHHHEKEWVLYMMIPRLVESPYHLLKWHCLSLRGKWIYITDPNYTIISLLYISKSYLQVTTKGRPGECWNKRVNPCHPEFSLEVMKTSYFLPFVNIEMAQVHNLLAMGEECFLFGIQISEFGTVNTVCPVKC